MQNENIKNLEPVVEIKNSNQIQEPLTDTTLPTQPQKQRAYSSTNIPLEFEPDDDIDAIMERFNNLSDEEQTQTKREICEYYGDKFPTQRETHRIHTPDFIYITGDKEKDEQKLQNILSRCHGSLAKRPNSTITVQEFKRRFLLEREAHKEFYGSNPYINALNDAMIQSSILDKVQNPDLYNSPETIELAQRLNYKMAYEDPNLKPFQYALNTITPTINTTPTLTDAVVDNENTFDENKFLNITMYNFLKNEEGCFPYPYTDTNGIPTIGIGTNIEKNTKKLPWYYLDPQTKKLRLLDKTDPTDIKILEKELKKLDKYKIKHNDSASNFETRTNLRISPEYIQELYIKRTQKAINDVRSIISERNKNTTEKIPEFEKLPHKLQIVLVDMAYNLGKNGFNYYKKQLPDGKIVGYPKFWNALALHNIDDMILESRRFSNKKPLTKRNNKIKELLEEIRPIYHKK